MTERPIDSPQASVHQEEMIRYITETFEHVESQVADENYFFFYGSERMFPWATLMTNDVNDTASDSSRPGVFRLNIGVSKETYQAMFGSRPRTNGDPATVPDEEIDFTALDKLMPHPVYARQYWVCVLNPGAATFQTVQTLLAEAYARDVSKHKGKSGR